MHAAKGTPERDAYDKKLAMMKEAMGSKAFFLPSLGRTDLSIKFHNRLTVASKTFVIDCSEFDCDSFFEELWWLGVLVSLNFSHNRISMIPDHISMLENLSIIKLNHNRIVTIPNSMCDLTRLQRLFLHNNNIEYFPGQISKLTALLTLTMEQNPIKLLPFRFGYLPLRNGYDKGFQIFRCDPLGFLEPPEHVMNLGPDQAIRFMRVFAAVEDGSENFLMSNWNLQEWPVSFGKPFMYHITLLDLSHNLLSSWHPSILEHMTQLTTLNLSFNKITEIPLSITSLCNMKKMLLEGNNIAILPAAVAYVKCLETFTIDFENLVAPSKVILALGHVKVLEYLKELNAAVGKTLSMTNKSMAQFPIEVCTIDGLRGLDLSNNRIDVIPDEIESLKSCTMFDCSFNVIEQVSPNIANMRFEELKITNNLIKDADCIFRCSTLSKLTLDFNEIELCGPNLGEMTLLKSLSLNKNKIAAVDESVGMLRSLVNLFLSDNLLCSLPDSFSLLTALKTFNATRNLFSTFPKVLCLTFSLQRLLLSANQFTLLDDNIGNLTSLVDLDIEKCPVIEIPPSFSLLPKLKSATVWDAFRFEIPSQSIVKEGMGAIQSYLGKFYASLTNNLLDIRSLRLESFPIELLRRPEYVCIENLCLDDNPIKEVPPGVSRCLPKLVSLSLKNCDLSVCSSEFEHLKFLKQLYLDSNINILRIPWSIFDLPHLEYIGWSNLVLISPPAVIMAGNVPNARLWISLIRGCDSNGTLDIRDMKLEVFPEDLFLISTSLTRLFLDGNVFDIIPATFVKFQVMIHLDMRKTLWKPFEQQISECLKMKCLILSQCGIKQVSQYIFKLINLEHLDLSSNELIEMPKEICRLSSLTELLVNDNPNLKGVPVSIGNLLELKTLDLSGCCVGKSLPYTLSSLRNLKALNVTKNCITHLPPSFGHLIFVPQLLLDEESLLFPYPCLIDEGRDRWMEFLRIIDMNSTTLDNSVDLSYWKLPFWPLELFGLPALQELMLNGNSILSIPCKHEIPNWLQIEMECRKFKDLEGELESDSTNDSQSEDLLSQHTESVDSMLDENDAFGIASKQLEILYASDSSSDEEQVSAKQTDDSLIVPALSNEELSNTTENVAMNGPKFKIKPKIARLAAKIEALFSIRNGGIIYWHSKQSVEMMPFPDISICRRLVHLEISGNEIEKLPPGLFFITALEHLDVSYNRIEELSWGLAALQNLKHLNVVGNPIELLPRALVNLTKLDVLEFDLDGRIVAPHMMIQKDGLVAMRKFWHVINKGLASGVFDFTKLPMPEFPLEFTTYKYGHINTPCKRLLLQHNNLESLDAFAPQYLQKLQFLDCSYNKLRTLPHFIKDLVVLEEIIVDYNEIERFPWQLGWTRNLKKISFNNNMVDQLPTSLYLLSGLTSISANNNRFEILPRNLKQFPSIVEIFFSKNQIRLIPDAFVPLDSLKTLDLSHNHLTRVSLALLQATSIQNLKLNGNPIRSLPFGIHALVQRLSTFTLDWSKIIFPPKAIVSQGTLMIDRFQKQCVHSVDTRELILNDFRLDHIPPLFNKLETTTHLNISGNSLMFFPLTKLVNLKSLNASRNVLSTIPVDIGRFISLSNLNLSSNSLGFLPASFSNLLSLVELKISKNRLIEFPECFTRLTSLQMIDATQNLIRSIPEDIGGKNVGTLFDDFKFGMLALQNLDFTGNSITSIPDSFKTLSNLRSVNFTGNKIFEIPTNLKHCTNLTMLLIDWQYLTDLKPLKLDLHLTTFINGVSCPVEFVIAGISKMKEFFRKIILCIKSAEIDFSNCELQKFPTDMKCIDFLQKLDLKMNKIQYIPKVFEQYQDLVKLDLSNNKIKQLPSSLSLLTGLETLDMSNNLLESLPCELYHIPAMREFFSLETVGLLDVVAFKWAGNESTLYDPPESILGVGFEQLPVILKYLKHIFNARKTKQIMILDIPLTKFPRTWVENDSSWAKVALTSLQISGTKIQDLPETIERMSNLRNLVLTRNYLEAIPETIGNIETLQDIDVSMNPLYKIPIQPLKKMLAMKLKTFLCNETFIPSRPAVGRPAFFLADYFDYLQKYEDARVSGKFEWHDIELAEISEDIYYWPMKSLRMLDHKFHESLKTPPPVDLSVEVCPNDLLCENENCKLRHPKKKKENPFVDPLHVNIWSDKSFGVKLREIHVTGIGVSKLWLLHRLVDLTVFNASGNAIRTIPPTISRLTNLTILLLDRNPIVSLPIEFGGMISLKSVSMCGNQLKEFPASLNELTDLRNLSLSRNFLRTFPVMPKLSRLCRLDLDRNILVELPSTIFLGLDSLTHLDLSYNALNDLPATVGCLTKLETCILNSNALQFIPKSFANLPNVSHLAMGRNMICLFPKQLQGMKFSLLHLRINDNSILKIPTWIRVMKALTEIFLDGITITEIPDMFFELTTLTTVSAERNRLEALNPKIVKLSNLTHLSLSTNVIREIPLTLFTCTKLIHLALDSNNLCLVQRFISRLAGLHELWLHRNQLKALPRTICLLTNLSVLSVAFNEWEGGFFPQITSTLVSLKSLWLSEDQTRPYLPGWIKSCTNLVDLNIDFSMRKKPPFHVQRQGIDKLFQWVLKIAKGSTSLDMDVSRFDLASIPWFEACRTLRRIDISRNNIVTFYTDMLMPNLLELICNDNRIVEFTNSILNCPSLRVLLAWNNRMTTISLPICSLPKLQRLELQRNRLSNVPVEIGKLVSLLYLDLTSNQLTTMPTSMHQMTSLQSITFEDNGLDTYLGPVAKQGVSIFLKYMESCFHVDMTQTIYLGDHGLESFPIHLCQQTSVTDLSLLRNIVVKVPTEIFWLRNLSKLSIRENKVKSLPESLTKCSITDLDIGMNMFDSMPSCLAKIFTLKRFTADNNYLTTLSEDFQYCGQLQTINLDQNAVSKLPTSWKNLFSLKSLSLRFNNISDVGGIKWMTQIESLFLEGNTNLTQLDLDVGCLTSLTELYVIGCNVSKVSGAIAQCKRLRSVNFSGNKLSFLPEHFFSLKNIVCLALDDNRFSPIPDFHLLHSLEVLSFSNNPIPIMPSEFGLLVKLVDVTFAQCLIKRLPSHLANFLHLERFAMPMNELVAVPPTLCECYRLRTLEFQHNKLQSIPHEFSKLTKLTEIFLHRNLFEEIPSILFECKSLKCITLHHCKLFVKKVPHKLDIEMLKDLKELLAVELLMHSDAPKTDLNI